MNLYVISLIDVLLNARYKPKEEYLLQDIKVHFSNIKHEIARDELLTGSSSYALERLDSFIKVLNKDMKTIKLLPLSERTIDVFEFTIKEIIELIEGNKVMIMLT
jgi:hypothetical protein